MSSFRTGVSKLLGKVPKVGLIVFAAIGLGGVVIAGINLAHTVLNGADDIESGLVLDWQFNGNAQDATPHRHHGNVSGAVLSSDRTDQPGRAYEFAGSDTIATAMTDILSPEEAITLSGWVRPTGASGVPELALEAPLPDVSGNILHLDAAALTGYDDGDPVMFWEDLSGQGNDATGDSYNDLSPPTYVAEYGIGPAVQFFGNADGAYFDLGSSLDAESVFFVVQVDADAPNLASLTTTQLNDYPWSIRTASQNSWRTATDANDFIHSTNQLYVNGSSSISGTFPSNTNRHLLYAVRDGSQKTLRYIGASEYLNQRWFKGRVSEVLFYDRALSSSERGDIEQYLTDKWGDTFGTGPSGYGTVIGSGRDSYQLEVDSDFNLVGHINGQRIEVPATQNAWQHVALTYDGTALKLFINGELEASEPASGSIAQRLNDVTAGAGLAGQLDALRIYRRALSDTEIALLYSSQSTADSTTQGSIAISSLQQGLLGHWEFRGNTKDSTPYRRHGTVTGGVTATSDRFNQANEAYEFNGSGDFITAGANPVAGSAPFTIAAWIKTDQQGRYSGALAIGGTGSNNSAYIGTVAAAQVGTSNSLGGGFYGYNIGSGVAPVGEWAHVALTFSGGSSGTAKIYINGIETNTTTRTPNLGTAANTLRIGRIATDTIYDFDGTIDDVRVYGRALDGGEIARLHAGYRPLVQVSDLAKGLIGDWSFDAHPKDATPYRHHGVAFGGVAAGADRRGRANSAYQFDRSNDYIRIAHASSLNPSDAMTLSMWIKFDLTTGNHRLVDNRTPGVWNTGGYQGFVRANGAMNFSLHTSGGTASISDYADSGGELNGSWNHLVFRYNGSHLSYYLNGQFKTQVAGSGTITALSNPLFIGSRADAPVEVPNGLIDDVRLYNRALSESEIAALFEFYR